VESVSIPENDIQVFKEVCADFYRTARAAAADGQKVAGYMCSYSPQELLHAAGYLPVRVLGRLGATPGADALMQPFICSFARSSFDAGLSGELDFLDIMMFSHTCDTMQNLADLWQCNCPNMKTIISSMPNLHQGRAAAEYFRGELDRVRACIEAISGPIADEKITETIQLYDRHRAVMRSLFDLRRASPGVLTGTEMMYIVLSSFLMPREKHLELVTALSAALSDAKPGSSGSKRKVVVSGSVCQAADFILAIESAGCVVVDDDLCVGTRSFLQPSSPGGDPMEALTQSYMGRTPCPAIHKPGYDPGVAMVEKVRQSNADGVVFLITKYCDPFGFDYPYLCEKLESEHIPTLMLEIEQHLPVPEQLRTRMEAFVEILAGKQG
jgi:bcr-type benzoyl-CoA reductase subunit C